MNFGVNTFLFTSPFTTQSVELFPKFKKWGFDSVEIALEDPAHIDARAVKNALDAHQLTCDTVCAAMGPGRDLRGTEKEQHDALEYLKGLMDVMPALGAKTLAGPLYSSVGRAEGTTSSERKKQQGTVARHLQELCVHAEATGVRLAIEPLNRYETDFINTCDQALELIGLVNSAALGVHLDTYHMNIEEKHPADAILNAGEKLYHVHACGTDRGTPGNDHTNWNDIVSAIRKVNFRGSVVIESFTTDVKVIAKAASIWRQFEPSQEDIAIKGLQFLHSIFKQ